VYQTKLCLTCRRSCSRDATPVLAIPAIEINVSPGQTTSVRPKPNGPPAFFAASQAERLACPEPPTHTSHAKKTRPTITEPIADHSHPSAVLADFSLCQTKCAPTPRPMAITIQKAAGTPAPRSTRALRRTSAVSTKYPVASAILSSDYARRSARVANS
jgi:hypothetical protein